MSKTVVIHQPDFLPHLGFFHRLLHADLFVVLDTAQYVDGTSRSWMNRDKIKTPSGERWITVSVKKAPKNTAIREIELSSAVDWRADNLNLIREHYRRAAFFDEIYPGLERLYASRCSKLVGFNLLSIDFLAGLFDIGIPRLLASELPAQGSSNARLVEILGAVGATRYLSGPGARDYFEPEPYRAAGIEVLWQQFEHPRYPQLHGEFVPYLSSIDLLLNCGIAESRKILRSCQ